MIAGMTRGLKCAWMVGLPSGALSTLHDKTMAWRPAGLRRIKLCGADLNPETLTYFLQSSFSPVKVSCTPGSKRAMREKNKCLLLFAGGKVKQSRITFPKINRRGISRQHTINNHMHGKINNRFIQRRMRAYQPTFF